jgi:DNA helicase MCM9
MFVVKLAVALTIIGGVPRVDPVNGSRTRGECHMLMVGEPGTGKSQFLRYRLRTEGGEGGEGEEKEDSLFLQKLS